LRRAILGDTGAVGVSSDFFGNNGDAVLFWRCNNGAGNKPLDKRQDDTKKKEKNPDKHMSDENETRGTGVEG
jgi:hypothetical protein